MPETVIAAGGDYEQDEAAADAAITPGYLVEETATGVAPHATAAGYAVGLFAREFPEVGRGIDDDYAAGDNVKYIRPSSGMRVRARIAADETITAGDALVSAGDGTLRALDTAGGDDAQAVVATAYEDAGLAGEVDLTEVRVE